MRCSACRWYKSRHCAELKIQPFNRRTQILPNSTVKTTNWYQLRFSGGMKRYKNIFETLENFGHNLNPAQAVFESHPRPSKSHPRLSKVIHDSARPSKIKQDRKSPIVIGNPVILLFRTPQNNS